jgi:peptidoglycan/LPS O-acetylase OafA/YrhL
MQVSLIFPALFWVSTKLSGRQLAILSFLLMLLSATRLPFTNLQNTFIGVLGMFLLGIALARHRAYLAERWGHLPRLAVWALTVGALLSYNYSPFLGRLSARIGITLGTLGLTSAIVIVLAMTNGNWSAFLRLAPCQFLGRISYSLYLTHLTVLYILIYVGYERLVPVFGVLFWALLFVVYIVASLLFAWAFFIAIERPCTQLSQRVSWWRSVGSSPGKAESPIGVRA